jgi:hypothetical protein
VTSSTSTGGSPGNISGDQAVALEFDSRLGWNTQVAPKTFFGRNNPTR